MLQHTSQIVNDVIWLLIGLRVNSLIDSWDAYHQRLNPGTQASVVSDLTCCTANHHPSLSDGKST